MATLQELMRGVQAPQQFNAYQNVTPGSYNYNAVNTDAAGKPKFVAPDKNNSYFTNSATNQANTQYNSLMSNLYNNINSKYNQFNQTAQGTDTTYQNRVKESNINYAKQGNNFSNNMLKRGLASSSLVTTGLGDIGLAGEKTSNLINTERDTVLNNLLSNYQNEYNSFLSDKTAKDSERQASIQSIAEQLYDKMYTQGRDQYGDSYNQYQLLQQQLEAEKDRKLKQQEAEKDRALQKELASRSGGGSGGGGYYRSGGRSSSAKKSSAKKSTKATQTARQQFEAAKRDGLGNKWIQQNGKQLKQANSSEYKKIMKSNRKAPQISKHSTNVYTVRKAGQKGGGRATL